MKRIRSGDPTTDESVIPAIGCNDGAGPESSLVLFVAGNPSAPHVDRLLAAASQNHRVVLAIEGYHQGGIYGTIDELRQEERAWLAKLQARAYPMHRVWYGISVTNAPWYAAQNPAYDSSSPLAAQVDEEAITEWLRAGCRSVFTWGIAYSSESSRWLASDAIYRAIRAVWPSGQRDAA